MTTFFCKTFVNVTVSCIISSSSKVFLQGLRARTFGKIVKCEIWQNTIFKYAMGNGFAALIPFSILSSPEVAQFSSKD